MVGYPSIYTQLGKRLYPTSVSVGCQYYRNQIHSYVSLIEYIVN